MKYGFSFILKKKYFGIDTKRWNFYLRNSFYVKTTFVWRYKEKNISSQIIPAGSIKRVEKCFWHHFKGKVCQHRQNDYLINSFALKIKLVLTYTEKRKNFKITLVG